MTMTTARTEGIRQSDRVAFRMPLEASWLTSTGVVEKGPAQTMLVSRNGGVLKLQEKLQTGQEITLKRQAEGTRGGGD